ncbi:hypothetical protein KIL84_000949 [Mauremys mutica]|uniref:Uncharacterized protein n=1 Tax=Mauremys mutica TaxID=74926 RepID=A0A9D4ATM5_9SAUR|nr:hypothetical protein KIL84_000949 [Mauremys mutica]
MDLFTKLGLLVNLEKSTLIPVQQLEFIDAQLDIIQARTFVPPYRFLAITDLVSATRVCPQISAQASRPQGRTHAMSSSMALYHIPLPTETVFTNFYPCRDETRTR